MLKNFKLLGAVAVAGLVATTGSAFTGTGVSTSGTAAASQFVGGQVSQSVTGATLSEIKYSFSDAPANTKASSALLTFDANADGKPVSASVNGGAAITCTAVAGVDHDNNATTALVYRSTCTLADLSVNTIAVTVSGSTVA